MSRLENGLNRCRLNFDGAKPSHALEIPSEKYEYQYEKNKLWFLIFLKSKLLNEISRTRYDLTPLKFKRRWFRLFQDDPERNFWI